MTHVIEDLVVLLRVPNLDPGVNPKLSPRGRAWPYLLHSSRMSSRISSYSLGSASSATVTASSSDTMRVASGGGAPSLVDAAYDPAP